MRKRNAYSTEDTPRPEKAQRDSQGAIGEAGREHKKSTFEKKSDETPTPVKGGGIFEGVHAVLVEGGVSTKRVEVWRRRLSDLGGIVLHTKKGASIPSNATHVFATSWTRLADWLGSVPTIGTEKAAGVKYLSYNWVQDCLQEGRIVPSEGYFLAHAPSVSSESAERLSSESAQRLLAASARDATSLVVPSGGLATSEDQGVKVQEGESSEKWGAESHGSFESGTEEYQSNEPSSHEMGQSSLNIPPATVKKDMLAAPDLNSHLTGPFKELMHIYSNALGDDRRYFSYYKAVSQIEKLPFKVTRVDQVKNIPGIGVSIRSHIQEIISTGKLQKLEQLKSDEKVRSLALFGSVWGIGPVTAKKLYDMGLRTLNDLEEEPSLTTSQRIALKYLDDINRRIQRERVAEMECLMKRVAAEVRPGIDIICGGSYRRGKATVGDMDMVVTHPDGKSHTGFLQNFIQRLKDIDFITEDLMVGPPHSVEGTDLGVDTYFGLCRHPDSQQRHRIDIKVYPRDQYAFGLIAWTGNDVLNRRLRLLAEEKGYKLDDHGLYQATPRKGGTGGERYHSQVGIACANEKDVFDVLGFPWLEPYERNL